MKKIFMVLFLSLFIFSCSENSPSTLIKEDRQEREIIKENLTGKIEKITEKIILEKCRNYSDFPSFYFFINDICYSLGISMDSFGYNHFSLTSSKKFEMVENYIGEIESFENIFLKNFEKDKENWYKKYNYKYIQIPKDFTIYNEIPKQFAKILKEIGIKKLPENYIKLNFDGSENESFKKFIKEEKEFIKDGINGKIDYSKIDNLDLENLYEEIKKELEKNI